MLASSRNASFRRARPSFFPEESEISSTSQHQASQLVDATLDASSSAATPRVSISIKAEAETALSAESNAWQIITKTSRPSNRHVVPMSACLFARRAHDAAASKRRRQALRATNIMRRRRKYRRRSWRVRRRSSILALDKFHLGRGNQSQPIKPRRYLSA